MAGEEEAGPGEGAEDEVGGNEEGGVATTRTSLDIRRKAPITSTFGVIAIFRVHPRYENNAVLLYHTHRYFSQHNFTRQI